MLNVLGILAFIIALVEPEVEILAGLHAGGELLKRRHQRGIGRFDVIQIHVWPPSDQVCVILRQLRRVLSSTSPRCQFGARQGCLSHWRSLSVGAKHPRRGGLSAKQARRGCFALAARQRKCTLSSRSAAPRG